MRSRRRSSVRPASTLHAGETFYTQNLGFPQLREDDRRLRIAPARPVAADKIAVTSSGMSALMLITQALVGAG